MARIEANNEREATPKAAKQNPSKARTTDVASCHDDGRPSPRRENMMSDMEEEEEEETKTSNGATFFSLLEKLQLLYIVFIAVGGASEGTRSKRKLKQTRPTRPTMSSALMLVAVVLAAMFMTVYVPRGVVAAADGRRRVRRGL